MMITDPNILVDSYNGNALWEMARKARVAPTGTKPKKAELMQLMQQAFFKPERIKRSYRELSKLERNVLNRLQLHGGQVSTRLFKRELLRAELVTEAPPPKPPKKDDRWYLPRGRSIYGRVVDHIGDIIEADSSIFEDVIARLTASGLVFSGGTPTNTGGTTFKLQFHPGDIVFIPPFVSQHLPEPEHLPLTVEKWQPVHTQHGDPQLFLRDLYLYWDTVRRGEIDLIKSGFVGKRGLQQLNAALLTPDPTLDNAGQEDQTGRLYLLHQLLQELKLVKSQGGKLHPTMTNSRIIPEFWQKTTLEQMTAILMEWRMLSKPLHFPGGDVYQRYDFALPQACNLLLTALAELPGVWIEVEDLLVWLQDRNSDFLFPQRSRVEGGRGYYHSYYHSTPEETIASMNKLERQFVIQAIASFLFQLGLVELGFENHTSNPFDWYAFRLTPLGTAVLQKKSFTSAEPTGQIIIQPNFQVLAMGPVPLNLLARLDMFAERKKVDRTAFEYQLSRESVYNAQQAGFTVNDIQRFLETVSPHELPQNIRRTLDEWAAHHERIVFRRGVTLLHAADESLLERLLSDSETGRLLARPVGKAIALVRTKQQTRLVGALQDAGLFPAVSGANPEAADKSVTVDENGRIQPIHAVPSLHLRGRLSRFAEETEDGWLLTEQSVNRAGGSKKKAQNLTDELGKLSRGQLPKDLVARIRAWGGYYGSAVVGTMTLVEFRDQETLAELCQMPQLKELLNPFAAGDRALAVVDTEQVSAVQSILSELGVQVVSRK